MQPSCTFHSPMLTHKPNPIKSKLSFIYLDYLANVGAQDVGRGFSTADPTDNPGFVGSALLEGYSPQSSPAYCQTLQIISTTNMFCLTGLLLCSPFGFESSNLHSVTQCFAEAMHDTYWAAKEKSCVVKRNSSKYASRKSDPTLRFVGRLRCLPKRARRGGSRRRR